jgi:hypothetical protein
MESDKTAGYYNGFGQARARLVNDDKKGPRVIQDLFFYEKRSILKI